MKKVDIYHGHLIDDDDIRFQWFLLISSEPAASVIALIETRSCSVADRTRGWIETRLGDTDTGLTTIDTAKPFGLRISFR